MSATVAPSAAARRTSASRVDSGVAPDRQGGGGEVPVDDPLPRHHRPDAPGQLGDRRVLDEEARRAHLHRPAQEARPAERGEDDRAAVRHRAASARAASMPSAAGHLDVQQRHVGPVLAGGLDDGVAAADLGDDLEVLLQLEQRPQGAADERLVLGDEHADHRGADPVGGRRGQRGGEPEARARGRAGRRAGRRAPSPARPARPGRSPRAPPSPGRRR